MSTERVSYLDNASTSHPKPAVLIEAIARYVETIGASPSRGSHALARRADACIAATRDRLGRLLGVAKPDEQLAFTANATHALNLVIKGALRPGDHVVTTALEHNSVLRPLEHLRRAGVIVYDVAGCDARGALEVDRIAELIRSTTRLVVVNHGSNVLGTLADVATIATLCRQRQVPLLVDASQTAGFIDLDVEALGIDYLVFTGHKKLLGPPGTGGAYLRDPFAVDSLLQGGTGGNSNSPVHPEASPHKFDAGTANFLGLAGLGATVEHLLDRGLADVRRHELELTAYCCDRLRRLSAVELYAADAPPQLPIVSFNVADWLPPEVGHFLDRECQVMVRTGIHCAPLVHRAIGTYPHGTIRASFGLATTPADIDRLVDGVRFLCSRRSGSGSGKDPSRSLPGRVEPVDSEREHDARVADRGIGIGVLDAESEIDTRPVRAERELVQQVVTRTLGDLEPTGERGELVTNVPVRPSELAEDEDGPGRESYATERCDLVHAANIGTIGGACLVDPVPQVAGARRHRELERLAHLDRNQRSTRVQASGRRWTLINAASEQQRALDTDLHVRQGRRGRLR